MSELEAELRRLAAEWKAKSWPSPRRLDRRASAKAASYTHAADLVRDHEAKRGDRLAQLEHENDCLQHQVQQLDYPCSPHCQGYLRELELRRTRPLPEPPVVEG